MSFKPRDMVKNPKVGDTWKTDMGGFVYLDGWWVYDILNNDVRDGCHPIVCLPPDLALSLHAALTNPTPDAECERLRGELEKYLPRED